MKPMTGPSGANTIVDFLQSQQLQTQIVYIVSIKYMYLLKIQVALGGYLEKSMIAFMRWDGRK